jgi:hypothetical protein
MTNPAASTTPSITAPPKGREQLIAEERAAERAVVEAEIAWMRADALSDPTAPAFKAALDKARIDSLAIRKTMQDGLDAWTTYYAVQEVEKRAAEAGVSRVNAHGDLVG